MEAANFRDHRIYLVHLLRVLHEHGGTVRPADIYEEVADRAGVTAAQRGDHPGVGNPVYRNRIQFARQALIDVGAVLPPSDPAWKRNTWQLTAEGRRLAETIKDDTELDRLLQGRAREGARLRAQKRKESRALAGLDDEEADVVDVEQAVDDVEASETDTLKLIERLVDRSNEAVFQTMLDHLRGMNDTAFEHLVGTVLKASLRAVSVKVTQQTRDGGVDGVLSFDDLRMRKAVFEAKRYSADNTVGRPLIDAFATAKRRYRADHALFVTSSTFSQGARDVAEDENIRLIDGTALVELMARTGIGLRESSSFTVYELDPAWSLDEDDAEA